MSWKFLTIVVVGLGGACGEAIDDRVVEPEDVAQDSSSSSSGAGESEADAQSNSSSEGGEMPSELPPCNEYLDIAGVPSITLGELVLVLDELWCETDAQATGVTLEARRLAADGSEAVRLTSTVNFAPQRDIVIVEEAIGETVDARWNANLWIDNRWWSSDSWDGEHDTQLFIVSVDDEAVTFCAWDLGGLGETSFEDTDPTMAYAVPGPMGLRCPLR
jgi:hypothetical protein